MSTKVYPYLNFDGQSAEAMQYYHSIFGGELKIQTYGESGMADNTEVASRVIHADLNGDLVSLMASDTHPEYSPPLVLGNNMTISLVGTDKDELTRSFNQLSEGGTITMPLEKQFWGDLYGQLVDRFGIQWSVNIYEPVQGE
jgi:PhnB protein